jgi:predicted HAD superfamily Cof-like phosphohydrolase
MSLAAERLREFHEAFDVPMGESSHRELALRRRTLHREEHREVEKALKRLARKTLGDFSDNTYDRPTLEAVAEELADVLVIAYGTADLLGIDLDVAFQLKMDGNMAKLPDCDVCGGTGGGPVEKPSDIEDAACEACDGTGKGEPIKREDGKIMKPPGFVPPDMSAAVGGAS